MHLVIQPINDFFSAASTIVWGPVMLILLLGTGLYLTVGLRLLPLRRLRYGFRMLWRGRHSLCAEPGDISAFNALMTALSATVGTGNIAGVATAIFLGGPGAVFWMWLTALVGMATKYGEAVLSVRYRELDERGKHVGGPMYYIKNGMGRRWRWLGISFALLGTIAAFGIGNTIQANSVAHALESSFAVPALVTGLLMAVLAYLVLIGGIQRIGEVAGRLVPLMAALYVLGSLTIIVLHVDRLPAAVEMILTDAFTGTAASGGFAGASVMMAMRFGIARGIFSNEAGLGTAPIAHAAAKTNDPVRQGTIAMIGTFIDTVVICSMTALVIVMTGVWSSGETGAVLSALAFQTGLPGPGDWVVSLGLVLFAFTTVIGWSYYGERCAEYLFGVRVIVPYRILWVGAIPVGAMANLGLLWLVADVLNGLMAIPNLIALLVLSPVIFGVSREYFGRRAVEQGLRKI
jgi:AGCS family alanine or glycine:cation symporter